jgi:hypothetical protein
MAPIVASAIIAAGAPGLANTLVNVIFLVIMLSVLFSTGAALLLGRGLKEEPGAKSSQGKEKECEEPDETGAAGTGTSGTGDENLIST